MGKGARDGAAAVVNRCEPAHPAHPTCDEIRALAALKTGIRDWRKLEPREVVARFRASAQDPQQRQLLALAIFVGTAQACEKGSFWAPYDGSPGAVEVSCKHLSRPISRLYMPGGGPPLPSLGTQRQRGRAGATPRGGGGNDVEGCCGISVLEKCHPLDACARAQEGAERRHVAVVRFTSLLDPRNESMEYRHCREDQIFLRTTYHQSFEKMMSDLNAPVGDSIDRGGLIYTPDVAILRGPVEDGAAWFSDPPRADVIWVGLPPRPKHAEQQQYAEEVDRAAMAAIVRQIFALAAARDVDTLVLPPLGLDTHGCRHPSLDVAEIIHKAALQYSPYIPHVIVASDHPPHFENGWWEAFAGAVQSGRPAIYTVERKPLLPVQRARRGAMSPAEKAKLLNGGPGARRQGQTPRQRDTFL